MPDASTHNLPPATDHARGMAEYFAAGARRALALGNRGPIRYGSDGRLHPDILTAYRELGFYIFQGVVDQGELAELRQAVDGVLARAPIDPDAGVDAKGHPAFGLEFKRSPYRFARPLSDPLGGTARNKGRHPVKMQEAAPPAGAPAHTIELLQGNLHLMDPALRLYGHPGLLRIAEAVLGADFVPYNEVTFIKEPGLGPSVAWHRDGTTHWDAPDWDQDAHGFNFMTQLYPSTAGNGVWVLPGSHKLQRVDIPELVRQAGSERIEGAVPLLCAGGDTCMVNRQMVHGSFANSSPDRRVTLNAGFFPRKRVLNVSTTHLDGRPATYDATQIRERSRMIAIAIDARQQRFPDERSYVYQPLASAQERWSEEARHAVVKDYNVRDMYI